MINYAKLTSYAQPRNLQSKMLLYISLTILIMSTIARVIIIVILEIISLIIILLARRRYMTRKPTYGYGITIALVILQLIAFVCLPDDIRSAMTNGRPRGG